MRCNHLVAASRTLLLSVAVSLGLVAQGLAVPSADAALTKRQVDRWNDQHRERVMEEGGYTREIEWGCDAAGPRTIECPNVVLTDDRERTCRYFFGATAMKHGIERYQGKCLRRKAFIRAYDLWQETPLRLSRRIQECGDYGAWGVGVGKVGWTYEGVDGAGIFNVTTRRVRCRVARRFVMNYNGPGREWTCTEKNAWESSDTRCTASGGRVIRWQSGA